VRALFFSSTTHTHTHTRKEENTTTHTIENIVFFFKKTILREDPRSKVGKTQEGKCFLFSFYGFAAAHHSYIYMYVWVYEKT